MDQVIAISLKSSTFRVAKFGEQLEVIWVVWANNKAMPHEKVDDNDAYVRFELLPALCEERGDLLDGHQLEFAHFTQAALFALHAQWLKVDGAMQVKAVEHVPFERPA